MGDTDTLAQAARQYYTDLPYHNWQHVQQALGFAETLLERCERHDIDVDSEVVKLAIYFHDAGYHQDHRKQGYNTKEAYSAAIARKELEAHGIDPETIEQVSDCILATHREADFHTPEQKIVRAADLAQMGTDYDTFRKNSQKLRDEHRRLQGDEQDESDWVASVRQIITFYLEQDIRLTPEHDTDGVSAFHARVRYNLHRFLEEYKQHISQ